MAVHLHIHEKGILPKLGHQIVAIYDWLSGPAMTEQERISRAVVESETLRQVGGQASLV